jgi:hypothetical protein
VAASPVGPTVIRPGVRAVVGRRLRRIAVGYLGQVEARLRAGEEQPEA